MTVQVREASAEADPAAWLAQLSERMQPADRALLSRALALAQERYAGHSNAHGEPLLGHCREVTAILAGLRLDAGLLSGLVGKLAALMTESKASRFEVHQS